MVRRCSGRSRAAPAGTMFPQEAWWNLDLWCSCLRQCESQGSRAGGHGRDGNREFGGRGARRRGASAARLQRGVRRAGASARRAGGLTGGTGRGRARCRLRLPGHERGRPACSALLRGGRIPPDRGRRRSAHVQDVDETISTHWSEVHSLAWRLSKTGSSFRWTRQLRRSRCCHAISARTGVEAGWRRGRGAHPPRIPTLPRGVWRPPSRAVAATYAKAELLSACERACRQAVVQGHSCTLKIRHHADDGCSMRGGSRILANATVLPTGVAVKRRCSTSLWRVTAPRRTR